MVKINHRGNFSKTYKILNEKKNVSVYSILDRYGRIGVSELSAATPVDTGLTAASWDYRIDRDRNGMKLVFTNSNIQNGICIAVLLEYGHATRNGGWVEGREYIGPAIEPVFNKIADEVWKEVSSL